MNNERLLNHINKIEIKYNLKYDEYFLGKRVNKNLFKKEKKNKRGFR